MSRYAWLTPDTLPDGENCRALRVPDGEEWEAAVRGALLSLAEAENWEQHGLLTEQESADVFRAMWNEYILRRPCMPIGTVFMFGGPTPPDGSLLCDGSQHLVTDYPDLFDVIDGLYGFALVGYFRVPDMRSRMPIGKGQGAGLSQRNLAAKGGVEAHQLTIAEMPEHDHSVHSHGVPLVTGIELLPVSTPSIIPGSTGSAGGDGGHQNMPPFLALTFCIQAV